MKKNIISLAMLTVAFVFIAAPGFCQQPYYYINSPSKVEKPKIISLFEKQNKPNYKANKNNNFWHKKHNNKLANSYNYLNDYNYNQYHLQKNYNYPYSLNNSNYKYNNYFRIFN